MSDVVLKIFACIGTCCAAFGLVWLIVWICKYFHKINCALGRVDVLMNNQRILESDVNALRNRESDMKSNMMLIKEQVDDQKDSIENLVASMAAIEREYDELRNDVQSTKWLMSKNGVELEQRTF